MTGSESFFDALKAKRKSQNIEISEICEFTKIQPRYIEAIEKGDFTVLPNVYIRLFLRSYAIFIGADSAKALKDYELYTTGKQTSTEKFNSNDEKDTPTSPQISKTKLDSNPQISPKQIASGIGVIFSIILLLWWAGKITQEQSEKNESYQSKAEVMAGFVQDIEYETHTSETNILEENLQSIANQEIKVEIDNKLVALPDKFPLNENDFLPQKKKSELTQIVNLSAPYTISIKTLQETKLNISKTEKTKITELINKRVPGGQEFIFKFTSTINFEFWSSSQISVKLNETVIDNYLNNGNMTIRGSYEVKQSQLYLSFYNR